MSEAPAVVTSSVSKAFDDYVEELQEILDRTKDDPDGLLLAETGGFREYMMYFMIVMLIISLFVDFVWPRLPIAKKSKMPSRLDKKLKTEGKKYDWGKYIPSWVKSTWNFVSTIGDKPKTGGRRK